MKEWESVHTFEFVDIRTLDERGFAVLLHGNTIEPLFSLCLCGL